ncbi:MAG: magnesium/cobalt transporter CorA [Chthoniobacterales bacterium]
MAPGYHGLLVGREDHDGPKREAGGHHSRSEEHLLTSAVGGRADGGRIEVELCGVAIGFEAGDGGVDALDGGGGVEFGLVRGGGSGGAGRLVRRRVSAYCCGVIRLNYHLPGTAPATLLAREDRAGEPAKLTLIQYDADTVTEREFGELPELLEAFDSSKVNWINVDGIGDADLIRAIGERFGLHPLTLEDVLNTTQRPKVETFDDYLFLVSEMVYFDQEARLSVEQVSLFLGDAFVLTIQEERGSDVFERVRSRLRMGRGFARKRGADYLVYALLDAVVDQFFPVLEALGDGVEELEEELLAKPSKATLRRLYEVKRLLIQLRRAAWPHREIFGSLMRDDSERITQPTTVFLRDCYDHITQIIDIIESYRDLSAGLMDVYLSSLGFRTNEIMRVLTVVSTIFIPLTFLAGVYGMNFDTKSPYNMPELDWEFGYLYFWAVSALIVGATLLIVKRNKWL